MVCFIFLVTHACKLLDLIYAIEKQSPKLYSPIYYLIKILMLLYIFAKLKIHLKTILIKEKSLTSIIKI